MLTKEQLIEAIGRRNPSADPEFLAQFSYAELTAYLAQLDSVPSPADCELVFEAPVPAIG